MWCVSIVEGLHVSHWLEITWPSIGVLFRRWSNQSKTLIHFRFLTIYWNESLQLWPLNKRKQIIEYRNKGPISCLDVCNETSLIAYANEDRQVIVLESAPVTLTGHSKAVVDLSFSPNGRWLASVDDRGHVFVWSTASWNKVFQVNVVRSPRYRFWDTLTWNAASNMLAVANCSDEVSSK